MTVPDRTAFLQNEWRADYYFWSNKVGAEEDDVQLPRLPGIKILVDPGAEIMALGAIERHHSAENTLQDRTFPAALIGPEQPQNDGRVAPHDSVGSPTHAGVSVRSGSAFGALPVRRFNQSIVFPLNMTRLLYGRTPRVRGYISPVIALPIGTRP